MSDIKPRVSIIIPHWNNTDILSDCLESITLTSYLDLETIVVDNASTDDSVEWVRSNYPKVKLIENDKISIDNNTSLIGEDSPLDSMNIVNLCLRLEDLAKAQNFNFDWSGETMSRSKSMFRSVASLSAEFLRQKNLKKN